MKFWEGIESYTWILDCMSAGIPNPHVVQGSNVFGFECWLCHVPAVQTWLSN